MIAFLAATARDLGARRVGLVAPYLAFMRQDVQFKPGEGVTSTYFGAAGVGRGRLDGHRRSAPAPPRRRSTSVYSIPTPIARAAPAIARWVAAEIERPVLVGPDAESVQWVVGGRRRRAARRT